MSDTRLRLTPHLAGVIRAALDRIERKGRTHGVPAETVEQAAQAQRFLSSVLTAGHVLSIVDVTAEEAHGEPRELLTVQEAADVLNVSESTAWRRVASGELPSVKDGGLRRIRRDDLDGYIARLAG